MKYSLPTPMSATLTHWKVRWLLLYLATVLQRRDVLQVLYSYAQNDQCVCNNHILSWHGEVGIVPTKCFSERAYALQRYLINPT